MIGSIPLPLVGDPLKVLCLISVYFYHVFRGRTLAPKRKTGRGVSGRRFTGAVTFDPFPSRSGLIRERVPAGRRPATTPGPRVEGSRCGAGAGPSRGVGGGSGRRRRVVVYYRDVEAEEQTVEQHEVKLRRSRPPRPSPHRGPVGGDSGAGFPEISVKR